MKEDVEGTATTDEHLLEPYVPNDRVQNKGEVPWLQNIGPLVSSVERNGLVRPVLILGVSNLFIGVVEGHDNSGGKLPLSPVLQGNLLTKDATDASIEILVGVTRVLVMFLFSLVLLIRPLVVPTVVFVAVFITAALPFAGIRAVDGLQTPVVPHCMAKV
jgi:hypothetical protein